MDKLKSITEDIKNGWQKLEKKKRMQGIATLLAIILILFMSVYYTQRTEYKVLFSELEDADAGAIVEDLETKGISYKLQDNGSTILIDKDLVDNYRIEIAVDGPLPSKSTGFEIFDSTGLMTTDDDRSIMYQRAITGELERAISSIDSVKSSKVILNIPESSVFQNPKYQKEATASVVLDMNNSQSPSASTIQGITALVSSAVDNLSQENIQIVDTQGNLLSANSSSDSTMNSDIVSEHQRIKNMVESNLEEQVISLLAPIYGRDKVHISVNANLNFDAIERDIVQYENSHIRSRAETVTGNATLASQVQDSLLNENIVAVVEDPVSEDSDNSYYEHATNYELDTIISKIVEAPGKIEGLTAAVVILDKPKDQKAVQGLVRNALGINNLQNNELADDSVQIEYMEPASDEKVTTVGNSNFKEAIILFFNNNWWKIILVILLILLLIAIIRVRQKQQEVSEDIIEIDPQNWDEVEEEPMDEETILDMEIEEKMRKNQEAHEKEDLIRQQIKENPELASELVKIWLKDDK